MSNADDVRWLAQKVVAKAFHGVSDASVEALARRVLELEASQGFTGAGDPVLWDPVPDDVAVAVCVHYRDELVKAFERAPDSATWRECIDSVRMLGKSVRARGASNRDGQPASPPVDRMSNWRHNTADPGMYFVLHGSMVALVTPRSHDLWGWSDCKNGRGGHSGSLDEAKAAAEASLARGFK